MSQLVLRNNSVSNPQTLDLTAYMNVQDGAGMDTASPSFSQRIFSHSLLKQGATLALEQMVEREMVFPLLLGPIGGVVGAPTNLSQTLALVQAINQIITTPGATATWQPLGASQATTFDLLSGLAAIKYSYRKEGQAWTEVELQLFTQPLGRTAGPRPYAAASGVGPLLMISPYASGGALAVAPSSSGFGGSPGAFGPNGASGGISYFGSPSLAGDAPAQLQISWVGPLPVGAGGRGAVPCAAVSLLPDPFYQPLITPAAFTLFGGSVLSASGVAASQYLTAGASQGAGVQTAPITFSPLQGSAVGFAPTNRWTGQHRLFAISRASQAAGCLQLAQNSLSFFSAGVTVYPGADWGLYDLGTFSLRASEVPQQPVEVAIQNGPPVGGTTCALDINAFVMLPDNTTWYLNPQQILGSQYGYSASEGRSLGALPLAPYTNTLLLDDTVADQFIYAGGSQAFAPSPVGSVASSSRVTQFTRGLVPAPDPKDGLPIIAVLGVAQNSVPSQLVAGPLGQLAISKGASWVNPQNLRTMAQVNVVEHFRYVAS